MRTKLCRKIPPLTATGRSPGAHAVEFYVVSNGSDQHPGTADAPMSPLESAQQAVRLARRDGIILYLRGSTCRLDRVWVLKPEDSGDPDQHIVRLACKYECPVISRGMPATDCRPMLPTGSRPQYPLTTFVKCGSTARRPVAPRGAVRSGLPLGVKTRGASAPVGLYCRRSNSN